MENKKPIKIFTLIFFLSTACAFRGFSAAIINTTPFEGIEWSFETTMGYQDYNNSMMSKEGSSSSIKNEVLFFYGILFHAYIDKMPVFKSKMNLGLTDPKFVIWSDSPRFNYPSDPLNELLRCVTVDVQYLMPSVKLYRGTVFPFFGYSFFNYSYAKNFSIDITNTFKFNAFSVGLEYNNQITKSIRVNYYFSFAPLFFNGHQHLKPYLYLNYGGEAIFNTSPVAITVFLAKKNGFNSDSQFFYRDSYMFSTTEIGLSFHFDLGK